MTESLKDEIFELTKNIHIYPLPYDTIEQILKAIEKRIDSMSFPEYGGSMYSKTGMKLIIEDTVSRIKKEIVK
jgi:hypothetical protein